MKVTTIFWLVSTGKGKQNDEDDDDDLFCLEIIAPAFPENPGYATEHIGLHVVSNQGVSERLLMWCYKI